MSNAFNDLLDQPAFATSRPGDVFIRAVRECCETLRARFSDYAAFLQHRAPQLGTIDTLQDVEGIPALFLPILKSYAFPIPADVKTTVRLTSSGTTGHPSITPLDDADWQRRVRAMYASYQALDLFQGDLAALAFLMDPATTKMAGSLVIDGVLRQAPQIRSINYLARMGTNGPEFPVPDVVAAIQTAAALGPVVFIGYPALITGLMQGLIRSGRDRFPLPSGSRILTGGGWKSFLSGVRLDQSDFRRQAASFFDIPLAAIRDMYGLSECPAVFVQCEQGNYHVPAWAWARAIDPETNREVREGEIGLLELTVPLTTSYPLLKVLTTDKARIGSACPCGRKAATLTPCGRATAARFETCAMKIDKAVA